jgi:hypothetical protein
VFKDKRCKAKETAPVKEGVADIIVAKQRNGPTGTVQLAFVKAYTASRPRTAALQPPYAGNSNNPRMKTMALATSTTIVYPTISLAFRRVIPSRASAQKGCNMLVHSSP